MNNALVVKTSDGNWEVVHKYNILNEEKLAVLESARANGLPITGMITTPYGNSVRPLAIWNGTSFSGGTLLQGRDESSLTDDIATCSILAGDKIVLILYNVVNDQNYEKFQAAFQSEVTLIPINIDNIPQIGWIWDGEQFLENN